MLDLPIEQTGHALRLTVKFGATIANLYGILYLRIGDVRSTLSGQVQQIRWTCHTLLVKNGMGEM